MFRNAVPAAEPDTPAVTVPTPELVPLSVLALDLPAPEIGGWGPFLSDRHIEIVVDDVGRLSISRGDARLLFAERREAEARQREVMARIEQQAVEADRRWRASLPVGIPANLIPDGVRAGGCDDAGRT
jgi:hypothetical protein